MQLSLLLMDLIVSPFLLVVVLSGYRVSHVWQVCSQKAKAGFHAAVMLQFFTIMHDLLLLLPACLILLVSCYRFRLISWSSEQPRLEVWKQLLELTIDLPFVVLGVLVICSLWRMDILIQQLWGSDSASQRRRACAWQFAYLLRDLFVLPVLAIVLGTLVRIPALIAGFVSSCSSAPLESPPTLHTQTARVLFPEAKDRSDPTEIESKPRLEIDATYTPQEGTELIQGSLSTLKVHILGNRLWSEVSGTFGQVIGDVGKGLMPFNLTGNSNTIADSSPMATFVLQMATTPTSLLLLLSWNSLAPKIML